MDVAVSCAERRDQRRGREEMRAWGGGEEGRRRRRKGVGREKGWKRVHFTEDHKILAETGPLNKMKVTVVPLRRARLPVSPGLLE